MLRNLQVKSSPATATHHGQHTCSTGLSWRAQESCLLKFPQFHNSLRETNLLLAPRVAAFSDDESSLEPLGQRRIFGPQVLPELYFA
jgi:hypothetical protein